MPTPPKVLSTGPVLHFWEAEGTGEWTSRFVRPVCSPRPEHRRHRDDFTARDLTGARRCPDCAAIVKVLSTGPVE